MAMNPRLLRPSANDSPASIPGLALWLDASAADALYTTDAGPVSAVSSPLDIAGCVGWWDASDASTIADTSGAVDEWIDKSGNDNHATASTTARPTTGTRTLNGLNVLDFDGTANFMLVASDPDFATAQATYFIVFASDAVANSGVYMKLNATASTNGFGMATRTGSELWMYQRNGSTAAGLTLASGYAVSTARVYSVVLGSSAQSGARDGMVSATGTASISCDTELPVAIGARYSGGQEPLNGIIAEIVHYNTALTSAQRASVEAYLAAKWGIANVHAPAVSASAPVGYWRDRSGTGLTAVTTDATKRPLVATVNGRRSLDFDGVNDTLTMQGYSAENGLTGLTRFAVAFLDANAGTIMLSTSDNGINYAGGARFVDSQSGNAQFTVGNSGFTVGSVGVANTNYTLLRDAPHVLGSTFDGSKATLQEAILAHYDGATLTPTSTTGAVYSPLASGGTRLHMGSNVNANNWWNGKICEYLVYTRVLNAAQRRKVEVYLARKWGITLAPQVGNPEAQDWINRVYANGGTVSQSTANAVSTFCDAIESAGIRDRFARLSLFTGDNLNAALVPLYRSYALGDAVLGNTVDQSLGSPSFGSGDYTLTSGLQGNGTSKYLNTGVPMNFTTLRNYHLSSYVMANPGNNAGFIGADTNGDGVSPRGFQGLVSFASATRIWVWYNWGNGGGIQADNSSNSYAPNLITGVGSAASNALYVGGSSVATSAAQNDETISRTFPIYVFAANNRNTNLLYLANTRLGGYSIGRTMTAANVAAYNSAVAAFNAAIGRT